METLTYAPGETIIAEGTFGNQTYLIQQGSVLICKETGKKGRIPITTLGEGEMFGEMYLLDDAGFRSASVVAQTEVTVHILTQPEMEQQLAGTPPIIMSLLKTMSSRLAQTSQENCILKFQEDTNPIQKIARLFGGS